MLFSKKIKLFLRVEGFIVVAVVGVFIKKTLEVKCLFENSSYNKLGWKQLTLSEIIF